MSATTVLRATAELGQQETDELTAMKEAVYPNLSPAAREWAPREWGVFVRIESQLVSYTGIVIRDGSVDGTPATIGGIGGVATHPAHRGKGYASLGMARALDFMLGATSTSHSWSAGMSSSITTPSWAGIVSPGDSSRPNTADPRSSPSTR